jgi:hypothetical protein
MKIKSVALIALVALVFLGASSALAIVRTAPRWSFTEFYVSYASPLGTYDGMPTYDFDLADGGGLVEFDASDIYDPTYAIGFGFGQIRDGHVAYSLGFKYTAHELLAEEVYYEGESVIRSLADTDVKMHQFDLLLNINYYLTDMNVSTFAPYIGVGLHGGITRVDWYLFEDENDANVALSANFGFDVKLSPADQNRSYWALASANQVNLVASGNRPRYLHIGGAIKYYFKGM